MFLWGVEPRDSGSALDPDDKGRATYAADAAFDATAPASQDFLLRFCAAARKQPFFERSSTRLDYVAICAPELAAAAAAVPCNETTDDVSDEGDGLRWRAPVATRLRDGWPLAFPRRDRCCGHVDDGSAAGGGWRGEAGGGAPLGGPLAAERVPSYWPLDRAEFEQCLVTLARAAHELPVALDASIGGPQTKVVGADGETLVYPPLDTGVYFDGAGGGAGAVPRVRALALKFTSSVTYSNAFAAADGFHDAVDAWYAGATRAAPRALQAGYWTSNLFYYALQQGLTRGAWLSTLLSMLMAAVVLVAMTRSCRTTALAALALLGVVATETGVLVHFLGWRLGIIESIIFSVAVGMSVDFVSHLTHAYMHAPRAARADRAARVRHALTTMGVSITTAAVSTATAGLVMMKSICVFYYNFGARARVFPPACDSLRPLRVDTRAPTRGQGYSW